MVQPDGNTVRELWPGTVPAFECGLLPRYFCKYVLGGTKAGKKRMPFSSAKRLPYNGRKRLLLTVLDQAYPGGLRADVLAWEAGVSPKRAVYWRLSVLMRWGLVRRRRDAQGLLVYQISERGRGRLAWLRRGPGQARALRRRFEG